MPDQAYLNSTQHSVSWFAKTHRAGELELNPPFQRNPVWTDHQKSYLIDTILNGYPVPELYMQEFSEPDGAERHVVVDGQQRIRACLDFVEGRFDLIETETDAWRDLSFDDLDENQKKTVYGYNFQVRLLPEMPDVQLRAMFARLNRNVVALNNQELRHATYWGPFIKSMERIADEDYWSRLDVFTPNDIRRMLDVEYVSELAIAIIHGVQNKKDSLEKWYAAYESEYEDSSVVESTFRAVAGEIGKVLPEIGATRWRKKSDFYTLFVFLADRSDKLPLSREQRATCSDKLLELERAVTSLLREDHDLEGEEDAGDAVRAYALNVSRAASDLNSRRRRAKALGDMLESVFAA